MSQIAYLGPEGTFTETAARLIVGASSGPEPVPGLVPCTDIAEVIRLVEEGGVPRGVVPIENALEGSVTATLDALAFDTDVLIGGEVDLPVTLVAAAAVDNPGDLDLAEVVEARSHPVALASTRRWRSTSLPHAVAVPSTSTARAAEEVAELGGARIAIVNPLAAERYGLTILARGIADRASNTTRFVVLGREIPPPTGWDKTSIVVFIEHNVPGALLRLLEIFAERELDLSKIESRPTKSGIGDYCFFLDTEGHLADERVGDALAAVKRSSRDVKVLGSYRRSGARTATARDRVLSDDTAYREAATWLAGWRARIHP